MTNREIDALVAEHVMKEPKYWAVMFGGSHYGNLTTVAEAEAVAKQIQGDYKAHLYPYYDEPHYSTDIAAAWLVVERMQADGLIVIVTAGHQSNRTGVRVIPGCAAPFPVEDLTLHPTYQELTLGVANAETAPLAICMAALAAYGVEVSKS